MPPKKRNRDIERPSRTLHDFFNNNPKAQRGLNSYLRPSFRASIQGEIIVIDSDSDEEPEIIEATSPHKRRRLSPKRVHASLDKAEPCTSVTPVASGSTDLCKPKSYPSPPFKADAAVTTQSPWELSLEKCASISFGKPFLLVSSTTTTSEPTTTSELSSVQKSSLISSISATRSQFNTPDYPPKPQDAPIGHEMEEVDVWENGDDESVARLGVVDSDTFQDLYEVHLEEESVLDLTLVEDTNDQTIEDEAMKDDSIVIELDDFGNDILQETASPSEAGGQRPSAEPSIKPTELLGCDGKPGPTSNAFSVLMSSFTENEAWKEASTAEDKNWRHMKASEGRRKAPFYKVMQGMPIAVDAFKYGAIPSVAAYFLTHAHSDHYTNLSSSWMHGPIYCSEGTANLIIHMLCVDKKWVHPLPMDTPTIIPNTNGVTVTLIEANHCPGSCLFFFEGRQTVNAGDSTFKSHFVGSPKVFRYLHCGDFRASPQHVLHPAVKDKSIDHVYLDTTYLDPKYTFPPQPLVISACAELARRIFSDQLLSGRAVTMDSWMVRSKGKGKGKAQLKTLVVVGTYSIGKERIVKAIARALNSKVYCDTRKAAILRCQADPELDALLTSNPMDATVHLVPLSTIASDRLQDYLGRYKGSYDRLIGFRPTGWTYAQPTGTDQLPSVSTIISKITSQKDFTYADLRPSGKSSPTIQLYPVPYSEHSSFHELTCFALSFRWVKMIATVNVGSESSRTKMAKWVAKWEVEKKRRGVDFAVPHRHPDYW